MAKVPIGLQLYSVRSECKKDLPGTLSAVAEMGYVAVEFAGYYERSAEELRKLLDERGLKCCGIHTRIETILPDQLEETIEFNRVLGNEFLIVPGLPEDYRNSRRAWLETAKLFNEVSERVRAEGMYVGYHNHTVEFEPIDGDVPWEIFFGNTAPEVVMQLDTGNALHGGADPLPYLEKYPGRALTIHIKEFSSSKDSALIGEGDIDWERFFELCETVGGTRWYIVEQETYAHPPLECVRLCLENLRKMGK